MCVWLYVCEREGEEERERERCDVVAGNSLAKIYCLCLIQILATLKLHRYKVDKNQLAKYGNGKVYFNF